MRSVSTEYVGSTKLICPYLNTRNIYARTQNIQILDKKAREEDMMEMKTHFWTVFGPKKLVSVLAADRGHVLGSFEGEFCGVNAVGPLGGWSAGAGAGVGGGVGRKGGNSVGLKMSYEY